MSNSLLENRVLMNFQLLLNFRLEQQKSALKALTGNKRAYHLITILKKTQ